MAKTSSSHRSWTDLPYELLEMIGNRLLSKIDVDRFRAVCHVWRLSTPPFQKQKIPPIRLYTTFGSGSCRYLNLSTYSSFYHLAPRDPDNMFAKILTRNKDMLVKVDDIEGDLGSYETNYHLLTSGPRNLNLLDFQMFKLAKAYHLVDSSEEKRTKLWIYKVAMASLDCQCPRELMILGRESGDMSLYHCELGCQGYNAKILLTNFDLEDVEFYKGEFYVVYRSGRALVVNNGKFREAASPLRNHLSNSRKKLNLVESQGALLLVSSPSHMKTFKVFKLNEADMEWDEIKDINDQVLFVSDDCCFSVSSRKFPYLVGNCICFSFMKYPYRSGVHYLGSDDDGLLTSLNRFYDECLLSFSTKDKLMKLQVKAGWRY